MLNAVENLQPSQFLDIRKDFPIFQQTMNGKPLIYLDTASSAQKPQAVIDRMTDFMKIKYSNVHRGLYEFSQVLTEEYEGVRKKVANFVNASSHEQIVFTSNTTEAINLVAQSYGRSFLKEGDEILLSEMEHHANIVPWQILRDQTGVKIKVIRVTDEGELDSEDLSQKLSERTAIVSLVHISNSLGTVNFVNKIRDIINKFNPNIKLMFDGSQAAVHGPVDLTELDPDFYVFTGHKLYGPTGVGVLYGKKELLDQMPPYQGGGDMIENVSFEKTTYKPAPYKFEAGTPAILEVIGLGAAIDYLSQFEWLDLVTQEQEILKYAEGKLKDIEGIKIYGNADDKAGIISFTADWAHISDIAVILDQQGIAVRSGHHCCMPLMKRFGIEGTVRASFGIYNNIEDVDHLSEGLKKAKKLLS